MKDVTKSLMPEPLAIIGIGCHFPGGATSPQAFWELLCAGVDATREVPADRWDVRKFYDPDVRKPGKTHACRGGYLERLDLFDAHFFGISPREAAWLDPQQRLLLQVTWEALEDAGQVAERLAGSKTGVFIGGFTLDYKIILNFGLFSRYELQAHSATGMMMTMLANRISYVFGFRGPSMAVDTACSSSLVSVHLACQSIWSGECTLALAGGVNTMISPTMNMTESKGGYLSPDGQCRAFDASANGYARGEGAGVVLIKPLAQAQADGDPIYACIRGTAVNQDGHTIGITVPNESAQEAVMREAYQRAGIEPAQIQYVEAHGTGTPVGDPIEARAIGAVLSTGRPESERCLIGSVKTNIGHLEAGAGVAGLIKVALALKHRQIPPNLHFHHPHPDIPFEKLQLRIPTELEAWPATAGPAMAGVNSFGFGGTNAHVVLEEAPKAPLATLKTSDEERPYLLPISARSAEALKALARSYRDFLAGETSSSLHDIAYTASLRRSHHDHRLALVVHSKAEAIAHLDAFLAGEPSSGLTVGHVHSSERPKVAFVCSGMGPQWWAMARDLLNNEPVFRACVERCDAENRRYADWSLMEEMTASKANSRMEDTEFAQPANFAIQMGLAELWRAYGIEPEAAVGHSGGEIAAHYLAGVLSFEEAVRVVFHRGRVLQRTTGQGRMLVVGMTPEAIRQAGQSASAEGVEIAAINSPTSVTLTGEAELLEEVARDLKTHRVFHSFLSVKAPYHSRFMDPLREELLSSWADLYPRAASFPLYSAVTGTRITGRGSNTHYWWHNTRNTVLFSAAIQQMIQDGYRVFVELSPHPVMSQSVTELLDEAGEKGSVLPSLRLRAEDRVVMLRSLGSLYTLGYPVAWQTLYAERGNVVHLPSYPWQLKSYWTESFESREDRLPAKVHALLGQAMSAAHPMWDLELSTRQLPFLVDHRVQGSVLLPGAAYVEMALSAAREVFGKGSYVLEELTFRKALILPEACDVRLQTVVNRSDARVEIGSYTPFGEARWALHATARLRQRQPGEKVPRLNLDALKQSCITEVSGADLYLQAQKMGLQYGPTFQALERVQILTTDGTRPSLLGYLQAPAALKAELTSYTFHPALFDAACQVLLAFAGADESLSEPYLPASVERIQIFGHPVQQMLTYVRLRQRNERFVVCDIQVVDPEGNVLASVEGFRAQALSAFISLAPERIDRGLCELEWLPNERSDEAEIAGSRMVIQEKPWLIFADRSGVGEALARCLEEHGERYVTVSQTEASGLIQQGEHYSLNPANPEHFQQLCAALSATSQVSRVVYLWGLDSTFSQTPTLAALEQDQSVVCLAVMYLMQAFSQSSWSPLPRVWLVTRGAQTVGEKPFPVSIEQAPLWGLGRVIGHQELTSMWGGLVDLDMAPEALQASDLFEEIKHTTNEDQIAFRDGRRYVARLVQSQHLTPPFPPAFRPDGSYLITGGMGTLGLVVARWMVLQGARRLILMGRTGLPPRSIWQNLRSDHPQRRLIQSIQELERLGATVHLAEADVADEGQLSRFLAEYEFEGWPVIRGVMHTAGVVQDELLLRMTTETFQRVMRPKVSGSWLLHDLLKDYPLDFFLLFGSAGSVMPSLGQGNYAAANAFLDALASYRRSLGLPALSLGWGPWSVGMVERLRLEQFYTKRGLELITPEVGMQILGRVLGQNPAQLTAISVNWTLARKAAGQGGLPPMFLLLGEQMHEPTTSEAITESEFLQQLSVAEASERLPLVASHLQETVARVLQLDASQFSGEEVLTSLGMDSLMAVEVKNRLAGSLKVDVSVMELLQGMTIVQLATRILSSLETAVPTENASSTVEVTRPLEELQQLVEQADGEELERLLAEIEQISETSDTSPIVSGGNKK